MNSNRRFYHVDLADAGVRVYHENRKHSRPKDHQKQSKTFFNELEKAIVTSDKQPRIHSVDTFVHSYWKDYIQSNRSKIMLIPFCRHYGSVKIHVRDDL